MSEALVWEFGGGNPEPLMWPGFCPADDQSIMR
jgi:hypothetical protein